VKYLNSYGVIKDANSVECTNRRGKVEILKTANILVATGERPKAVDIPGIEHCIRSGSKISNYL
jgi:pyruvate/2-oxoglutarate dehydrogenase complex dihydrolipoamide dehydrogenase (E3) component